MAVIGLGSIGRRALEALRGVELIEVVGVADRRPEALDAAGLGGLPAFTDHRSLLVQTRPHAVYVALPPMISPDVIALCARERIHAIVEPPFARNLTEGASMVRQMAAADLKLAVATKRRFMPTYRKAFQLRRSLGQTFLARAHYLFNWGPVVGWRADDLSAGGGALLELGYHFVDLMVWMQSLPEEVFGVNVVSARAELTNGDDRPLPPNTTDDTAAAVLRLPDGCTGSLVTSRASGPVSEELALHGSGGSLTADSERCTLRDPDGRVLEQVSDLDDPGAGQRLMAESFAEAVLSGGSTYECSARENLLNLAVIDALYLAEKTSSGEQPETLLHAAGFGLADCLTYQPFEERAV
jgi:predicted dehydrogenase